MLRTGVLLIMASVPVRAGRGRHGPAKFLTGDPRPFGKGGTILGFAVDPAGNRIELIQRQ
jgi:hypothetical protein